MDLGFTLLLVTRIVKPRRWCFSFSSWKNPLQLFYPLTCNLLFGTLLPMILACHVVAYMIPVFRTDPPLICDMMGCRWVGITLEAVSLQQCHSLRGQRSRECFGLGGTFKGHLVQPPCSDQGHLWVAHVAQHPVQPGLENFQVWGYYNLFGQPVPVFHHPYYKKIDKSSFRTTLCDLPRGI